MERIKYKFLFRCAGEDPVIVAREIRPGDAEYTAKKLARLVAKRLGAETVECVWYGPADEKIPERIRKELTA